MARDSEGNTRQIINDFSSWRMSQGISYRQAGAMIGIDPGLLCRVESGKRAPSNQVLVNMKTQLNKVRRAKEYWGDSLDIM